jgi:hypothetical protein
MGQNDTFVFGPFRLDTGTQLLCNEVSCVNLTPKTYRLFSITRLKPPASSRLASADKMTRFEVCHGLQVWQSYGFSN